MHLQIAGVFRQSANRLCAFFLYWRVPHMKNLILLTSFLLSVVLAGCASATTTPTQHLESPVSPLVVQQESPVATPLPGPVPSEMPQTEDLPIPTQDPQMGSIEGSIIMQGYPPGTFPATLYLGDPTGSRPAGAYVALDVKTAIRGHVKSDGTFVFPNVPPGTYSLLAWTPAAAYVVSNPEDGNTWLIEISGNSPFDTGQIVIPPLNVEE
jgi:hypothetical protein